MRIALDAMGGDHAPFSNVNGAIEFIRESGTDSPYIDLYGSKDELQKKQFQIEVAKTKYNSTLQLKALHDPKNILMKK